jgi:probable rRNA maturation factor
MAIYIKNLQKSTRLHLQKIKRDLVKALRLLGLSRAELSVVFVNSERMKRLNARYRGVDKATDVLSFPLSDGPLPVIGEKPNTPFPLGDIVICVPTALLQAKEFGIPLHEEIRRLLVHGLLHLAGYDHELNAYQKRKMAKKERELIDALKTMA